MTSLLIKQLLQKILNERITRLEKRRAIEINQMKALNVQMKNNDKTIKTLVIKPKPKVIQSQVKKTTKPIIRKVMTMKVLNNNNKKGLYNMNKHLTPHLEKEKRTTSAIKKKYISKKNAEFEEIVKMHMIDFENDNDNDNDNFTSRDQKRTIEDSKLTINISIIDDDIDFSVNYLDQNEVEILKTLEAI